MKYFNVPLWCKSLIEQSKEAYIFVENEKITFLNEKAKFLMNVSEPDFDLSRGCKVLWENNRLRVSFGKSQNGKPIITNDENNAANCIEADGSNFEFSCVELVFSDKNNHLFKLNGDSDYSELVQASEQCYFSLFNTVKDAIFIQDRDGVILEANEGASKMYGYPRYYFKGKRPSVFSAYGEGDLDYIQISFEKAFNGEPQKFEFWGKRSNGEIFPKEIFLYKSTFMGKDVIFALANDITERKKAEAQLEAYTVQLQELIETRDKVYSIVAHDLRSSFNSILGLSELLSEDWLLLDEDRKQLFAKNIFVAADGSFKLLQNLLDWSKHQSGLLDYDPISFDMCGAINETLSLYRLQSSRKNILIQSEITSASYVYADVNMVQSILRNLISNAIKFTSEDGRVWITKSEILEEDSKIMICISVHDNGIGISQDRIDKLFDSRINNSTSGTANEPGTGLGILICKEMAEQNRGKFWVESEPGVGSVFSFTLPLERQ